MLTLIHKGLENISNNFFIKHAGIAAIFAAQAENDLPTAAASIVAGAAGSSVGHFLARSFSKWMSWGSTKDIDPILVDRKYVTHQQR